MAIQRKTKKRIGISLCVLILLALALVSTAYLLFFRPLAPQLDKQTLYIYNNYTIDSVENQICRILQQEKAPLGFRLISQYKQYPKAIRSGKYTLSNKDTPYSLFIKLSRGHQTPTKLVINNIRTLDQLAEQVGGQIMANEQDLKLYFSSSEILHELGYSYETLPALFIPNTYEVYWNMSAKDFIKRMRKEHNRFWTQDRIEQAQEIGLSPVEVATIASLVEEETNASQEKARVAGLYINRLHRDMLLQADPTIKFALQDFSIRRITNDMLTVESPYNTYKYVGLPPGPIRFPSVEGLLSVLNYEKHNYLYMCAKEDFSGQHNFSTNLQQHMVNARKYWRALNQRKIYK